MKIIEDYNKKNLQCHICKETRSVKYQDENGKPMCNKCALNLILGNN